MFKLHQKKILVSTVLFVVVVFGLAFTVPQDEKPPKRNLKVLPKDISHDDLTKVMDGFKAALGVRCDFCHAKSKTDATKLDFSSDEKPEKSTARKMMKMVGKINKKFFSYNKDESGTAVPAVACVTCHRGNPHPENK